MIKQPEIGEDPADRDLFTRQCFGVAAANAIDRHVIDDRIEILDSQFGACRCQLGRLIIVGDGAERPGLEALARDLALDGRVHFAGYQSQPEKLFGLFDIYALSSDTVQMPNTVVQAMAAGLPVAATDVGDVRNMVAEANRPFVVPKTDEGAFAAGLADLAGDGDRRRAIGRDNLARARQRYRQEDMVAAYARLLKGLG